MDLVICNTPLQILQIENLIKQKIIKENDFHLLFFVYGETKKLTYYYNRLSKLSYSSYYFKCTNFPFYILNLRKLFKGRKYKNIYTASIDNKIVHYILTFSDFNKIFTIDDGTANIFKSSIYYIEKKTYKAFISKIVHLILGCKFDLKKIKNNIETHYTIYPNVPNIIKKTKNNNFIFPVKKTHKEKKQSKEINLFLGTVYDEITYNKKELILLMTQFFSNKEFHYITHPRDNELYFDNVKYIDSLKSSEEIIIELLNKYDTVNIYGFNSSAQFNLMYTDGIKNHIIASALITQSLKTSGYSFIELNLDEYHKKNHNLN
ncbi:glycosyltransferase family 52 [Providencia huaxiensis]|uniref:glycosyltransferase family 52 n=1 Tax=Providencia TaxID=586 RepID=UPI00234A7506|nr:glycosyltransferase family 52 [Providencia sp. PROV076]